MSFFGDFERLEAMEDLADGDAEDAVEDLVEAEMIDSIFGKPRRCRCFGACECF